MQVEKKESRCSICKRRRIKCDGGRPSCARCIKGGWRCPGYNTVQLKFKDQTRQVEGRYAPPRDQTVSPPSVRTISASPDMLLASRLVSRLQMQPAYYLRMNSYGGEFMTLIPNRLGLSKALDDAVSSVCLAHQAATCPSDSASALESLSFYGQALKSLRSALAHPTEWKTPETHCATVVLAYYTMFADMSRSSHWVFENFSSRIDSTVPHANANRQLIVLKGPPPREDPLENAIYEMLVPKELRDAVQERRLPLTDRPEWKKFAAQPLKFNPVSSAQENQVIYSTLTIVIRLLYDVYNSTQTSDQEISLSTIALQVYAARKKLRLHLQSPPGQQSCKYSNEQWASLNCLGRLALYIVERLYKFVERRGATVKGRFNPPLMFPGGTTDREDISTLEITLIALINDLEFQFHHGTSYLFCEDICNHSLAWTNDIDGMGDWLVLRKRQSISDLEWAEALLKLPSSTQIDLGIRPKVEGISPG